MATFVCRYLSKSNVWGKTFTSPAFRSHPGAAAACLVTTRFRSRYARTRVRIPPQPPKFGDPGDKVRRLPEMDPSQLRPNMVHQQEIIDEMNPLVGKALSLEYSDNKHHRRAAFQQLKALTQRDAYDEESVEVEITRLTVQIRNLIRHIFQVPQDKVNKNRLIRLVGSRRRRLETMYEEDQERFQWICERLQIEPAPPRTPEYYIFYGKKEREVMATKEESRQVQEQKLASFATKVQRERAEWRGRRVSVLAELERETELLQKGHLELAEGKERMGLDDDAVYMRNVPDRASQVQGQSQSQS